MINIKIKNLNKPPPPDEPVVVKQEEPKIENSEMFGNLVHISNNSHQIEPDKESGGSRPPTANGELSINA